MVIIPFHSFAHITSPGDQRKALARIQKHLMPSGTFICTLRNPNVRQKEIDGQLRFFGKDPLPATQGTQLFRGVENNQDDDNRIVDAMQFEEYDAKGVLKAKRFFELHFRLSQKDEFEELAKVAGFNKKAFYGDYAYSVFGVAHS